MLRVFCFFSIRTQAVDAMMLVHGLLTPIDILENALKDQSHVKESHLTFSVTIY